MSKKRRNNEGSIYQRADGRWVAAYTHEGKQKFLYTKTEAEAVKKLRAVLSSLDRGEFIETSALTVKQWLKIWLNDYAKPSVRTSTYLSHKGIIENHLAPQLGKYKLQKLRAEHVQGFVNKQVQAGLSPATIKREMATLKSALKQAVDNQILFRSPAAVVHLPKQEQKEIDFLTSDEIRALLSVLPDNTHGNALRFVLGTGLRAAELCGLRWCDIGKEGLKVNQIAYTAYIDGEAKQIISPPKTKAGKRFIPLNDKLRAILDSQRQIQRKDRLKAGSAWLGGDPCRGEQFVFATATGTAADRHNLARMLRNCLRATDLKTRGLHALRHTFATMWIQKGGDIRTLSEILGHTNVAFTMQRYVHSNTAIKQRGMSVMADII